MRRGSRTEDPPDRRGVSILPRLATGISVSFVCSCAFTFLFFPVLRRGSYPPLFCFQYRCFYSSPSCDGDQTVKGTGTVTHVSILPRLATGIDCGYFNDMNEKFLFFPVLRRGSISTLYPLILQRFYSSPSCDGDPFIWISGDLLKVSILPRLATGIKLSQADSSSPRFLFFPVLRRGSITTRQNYLTVMFLFFPVLRRGSPLLNPMYQD